MCKKKKRLHNANLSLNVAFFRNDPHATSTAGWRLITSPVACQLASSRGKHPAPLMEFSSVLGSYLFVRALLAKTRSTSSPEGRPEPVVEVSARSEHCSSRGVLSKFFFPAGVDKTISRVSLYEAYFVRTYR